MRSDRPKPLHLLCGRPMLIYVLDALGDCELDRVVIVVGHGAERVTKRLQDEGPDLLISFVEQHVQRGTGDAVSVGLTGFPDDPLDEDDGDVLVLPGDTPLLRPATIAALVAEHRGRMRPARCSPPRVDDPTGYGRVVRGKDDRVLRIVEQRDATAEEREHRRDQHVDLLLPPQRAGAGAAPAQPRERPGRVLPDRRRRGAARRRATRSRRVVADDETGAASTTGCSSPPPRPSCGGAPTERWLRQGVTMVDPERTYIDATVRARHRRDPLPGHHAAGRTVVGDRRRDRPRHPPGRLRGRRATPSSSRPWAATPRSAPAPSSVPSPCSSRASQIPSGTPDRRRSTLREPRRRRRSPRVRTWQRRPMELVTKKRLCSCSGRSHPALAEEIADRPRGRARRPQPLGVRQRRDPLPLRRERSAAPTCSSSRRHAPLDGLR